MNDIDLERAARKLCELRNQDPDERIQYSARDGLPVARYAQRYCVVMAELRNLDNQLTALGR